jgi:hypothetical protein
VHRKVNFAVSTSFPFLKDIYTFGEIRDSGELPPVKIIFHINITTQRIFKYELHLSKHL